MKTYFIKFVYDNGACQERYSSIVLAENVDAAREHFANYATRVYPSSDDMCTIEMIFEMKDNDIMIIEGERRITPRDVL